MAGAGYKLFNTGDVLTAAQVNTYLMEQTVMVFADAAARTAALSGVVSEGMISYLKDTNAVEVYNGSAWVASDDPNAIQNTIVDAKGDLITATAADTPARLAVGANNLYLVADSTQSTGLKWEGAITSWTPTFTNLTVGNAGLIAEYQRIGNLVFCFIQVTLGSTSSVSGDVYFTLPVGQSKRPYFTGNGYYVDAGVAVYGGSIEVTTGGSHGYFRLSNATTTYINPSITFSATTPFSWGNGDIMSAYFWYEVA